MNSSLRHPLGEQAAEETPAHLFAHLQDWHWVSLRLNLASLILGIPQFLTLRCFTLEMMGLMQAIANVLLLVECLFSLLFLLFEGGLEDVHAYVVLSACALIPK